MKTFDLTVVAGRRPDLLARTLASFSANVLNHFHFSNVLVNIDPFAGEPQDGERCKEILSAYFDHPIVYAPDAPSFGHAVQRLWRHTKSDIVLHLEDDWLALEPIDRPTIESLLLGPVKSVCLLSAEKNWRGTSLFQSYTRKKKIFGRTIWKKCYGKFSTSPAFFDGEFLRRCAELMNPTLDPEKQFYNGTNVRLERYARRYQCRFLVGHDGATVIADIGRDWREERRISKELVDGVSVWSTSND